VRIKEKKKEKRERVSERERERERERETEKRDRHQGSIGHCEFRPRSESHSTRALPQERVLV